MNASPAFVRSRDGQRVEILPLVGCTDCGQDTPHHVRGHELVCAVCEVPR